MTRQNPRGAKPRGGRGRGQGGRGYGGRGHGGRGKTGRDQGGRGPQLLPRNTPLVETEITRIADKADGVGRATLTHNYETGEHDVFVRACLPGERISARPVSLSANGIRAELVELIEPSPERREADCGVYPRCGGCSLQHWDDDAANAWKQGLVTGFLERAGVAPGAVRQPHISPRHSRRRATFQLKRLGDGVAAGFFEMGTRHIVEPEGCSILAPELDALLVALRAIVAERFPVGIMVGAFANLIDNGVCLLLRGPAQWHDGLPPHLAEWAAGQGLARLSVAAGNEEPIVLYAPGPAVLRFGEVAVAPPPGAFLQPTRQGEAAIQDAVAEIVGGAARIVDLFAGCGTLSLPLLGGVSKLCAADEARQSLDALVAAAREAGHGARMECVEVDLLGAPLGPDVLDAYDAAILDPPRPGAPAQCAQLAESRVGVIAMVSCNAASFARDAATLCAGGYSFEWLQVVDQFRFTRHIEVVACFRRESKGSKAPASKA